MVRLRRDHHITLKVYVCLVGMTGDTTVGAIGDRVLSAQGRLGLGYVFSDGRRILDANIAACRITQYDRDELLALDDPFILLPPDSRERLRADLAMRMEDGSGSWLTPTQLIRKDGSLVPVEVGACVDLNAGKAPAVLAVFREVEPSALPAVEAPAAARVHDAVRGILHAAALGPTRLRAVGASLAELTKERTLDTALRAFAQMGLGTLALVSHDDGHYRFRGERLVERSREKRTTTCYLALGFLARTLEMATGRPAGGTELSCVSRGDAACEFELRSR